MGEMKNEYSAVDKNLKGSYNFKDVRVGGRIILKLALRK